MNNFGAAYASAFTVQHVVRATRITPLILFKFGCIPYMVSLHQVASLLPEQLSKLRNQAVGTKVSGDSSFVVGQ